MEEFDDIELDDGLSYENSEDKQVKAKKGKLARLKGLKQYRGLSSEEFDKVMAQKALGIDISEEFEKRIANKMQEFDNDYDLSDLKINDKDILRALIQAQITLEDYEQFQFKVRSAGISEANVMANEKLQRAMSDLRDDISKLQNDLNITRKIRKSDQDVSVLTYIDGLKEKAKKFYASKMSYIFCPKCNMLLATVWTLYPENERNKIALICERILDDGSKCGEKIIIGTRELSEKRGTNKKEITPESML